MKPLRAFGGTVGAVRALRAGSVTQRSSVAIAAQTGACLGVTARIGVGVGTTRRALESAACPVGTRLVETDRNKLTN